MPCLTKLNRRLTLKRIHWPLWLWIVRRQSQAGTGGQRWSTFASSEKRTSFYRLEAARGIFDRLRMSEECPLYLPTATELSAILDDEKDTSRRMDCRDTSDYCHAGERQRTGANMRSLIRTMTVLAALAITGNARAQSAGPFDGKWTTVVSCPAAEGAGSFTLLVDADVKGGVFTGEKGEKGKPGWYSLNGKVLSDGAVEIFARGIVPSSRLAAGNVPVGTAYGYPIKGRLQGANGTGARQGGRPCGVTFTKQ